MIYILYDQYRIVAESHCQLDNNSVYLVDEKSFVVTILPSNSCADN